MPKPKTETCSKLTEETSFLVDGLHINLTKEGENSGLKIVDRLQNDPYYCLLGGKCEDKKQIGISLSKIVPETDSLDDKLQISVACELFMNRIMTLLEHPFVQFSILPDGTGIGIADIRDLRNGQKVHLEFDLYQTDLTLAIFKMDAVRNALVFSWSNEKFFPFKSNF